MTSHVFHRGTNLPTVAGARGAELWATDGRRYLDGAGGAVVVGVGHGEPSVVAAIAEQAARVAYAHGTMFTSEALEAYAAELSARLPVDDARVYPVAGGSEATETALKMARAYHLARGQDRHLLIGRWGSYHGNTRGALDVSGRGPLRRPLRRGAGGGDRAGRPRAGGRVRGRAGGRRRPRRGRPARRLLAGGRRGVPPPRGAAGRRRGHDRVRAHRPLVRLRPLGRPPRPA